MVSAVKWAALPIIGPGIAAFTGWYNKMPLWSLFLMALIVLFSIYYIYVRNYIGKMSTLGCSEFHVGALKATRPEEYKLWQIFIQKDDFSFDGLYAAFNSLLVPRIDNSIDSIIQFSKGRQDALEATIRELKVRIEEYDQTIDGMTIELDKSDNAINYLVHLINLINTKLYRLTNEALDFKDLDLVTPFTIYNLKEKMLLKMQDIGTSANSLHEIDTSLPQYKEYAVVSAALSGTEEAFMNYPYPGRCVVAFSMRMLEGATWVWCFHFDDSDERALSLILSNDIIESRQIRRLIHAFCLIIQKRMIIKREAAADAV